MPKIPLLLPPIDVVTAKRAALRFAASVTVMSALGAVSHEEPRETDPFSPMIRVSEDTRLDPPSVQLAASRTGPDKMERLRRNSSALRPAVILAKARAQTDGVLLFDRCSPACESRDPLLVRRTAARTVPEPRPTIVEAAFDPAGEDEPAAPAAPAGLLGAMASGVSAATRPVLSLASGAGRLLPW